MKAAISVFILALFFGISSFAEARVDPSSDEVLKKEAEILKRVVLLTNRAGTSACSGTWLDGKGVIITHGLCSNRIEKSTLFVNGVKTRVLGSANAREFMTNGFNEALEMLVIVVDPKPLKSLNLPTTPLQPAKVRKGVVPPQIPLLIAGYGSKRSALDEQGAPIIDIQKTSELKLGANYVETSEVFSGSIYSMEFRSEREAWGTVKCKKGVAYLDKDNKFGCEFELDFSVASSDRKPITSTGDLGGPAFFRNNLGEWELLGVDSIMSFEVDDSTEMHLMATAGGDAFQANYTITPQELEAGKKGSENPIQGFAQHLMAAGRSVLENLFNSAHLKVDLTQPLSANFAVKAKVQARIFSNHINLASPDAHRVLMQSLEIARNQSNSGLSK